MIDLTGLIGWTVVHANDNIVFWNHSETYRVFKNYNGREIEGFTNDLAKSIEDAKMVAAVWIFNKD